MNSTIVALLIGKATPFRDGKQSAIAKVPVAGPVAFDAEGLAGDEQADRKAHGGPDMAVHHYPLDHHSFWRKEIGDHPLLDDPGCFGGNLAVREMLETCVHIGDRFRLGSALLEISQPRQPCWKIEHHFGHKGMVAQILNTARCGWYYRVIEGGIAQAGDELVRESIGDSGWSVTRAFNALWGRPEVISKSDLRALANLTALSPKLRQKAASSAG